MAKPEEPYGKVVVESYGPAKTSGLHGGVHIRPVAGQGVPPNLHVRCARSLIRDHPVGTRFMITAKLTDRRGGGEFLHSPYSWEFEVLGPPSDKS